jgi:hypothetical protein
MHRGIRAAPANGRRAFDGHASRMLSPMATRRERGLATAADIEHDDGLEVIDGEIVRKASPTGP